MNTHQTPEPSILQDSTLRPGHDEAPANPATQTRETVDPSSQDADNRICFALPADSHPHPHSHFPGKPYVLNAVLALTLTAVLEGPPFPDPDFPSLRPRDPHAFYQLSPQQATSSTLAESSCPGPFEGMA